MGFRDSWDYITGNSTSEDKDRQRDERARKSWERQGGTDRNAAFIDQYTNPSNPNYKGPGWEAHIDEDGHAVANLVDEKANSDWKTAQTAAPTGQVDAATDQALDAFRDATQPSGGPRKPFDMSTINAPRREPDLAGAFRASDAYNGIQRDDPRFRAQGFRPEDFANVVGGGPAGPAAPTINRDKIDPLLGGISTYANDIYALSKDNTGLSAAEAQLQKATQLANINAAIQADQSQRAALGAARGARNRGDRALLEQQAIGEAGYIGQEAARTAALRQAENEGNLAQLRATEENYDREFKLKALEKASQLGLNTAALEIDVSKANLGAASNLLNQQFQQLGIDKQLSSDQAIAVLNFAKDMATIQYKYDELAVEDQNEADRLLMQKYGIDQQTLLGLKQIKAQNEWDWTKFVSGLVTGVTPIIAQKTIPYAKDAQPTAGA